MCISFFETWDPSQRHTQSSQSTLIETQSIYAIKMYIERKSLKQSYCNGRLLFPSNFMKSSLLSLSLSSTCINRDDEPDHILMMNSDLMLIQIKIHRCKLSTINNQQSTINNRIDIVILRVQTSKVSNNSIYYLSSW